MTADERIARLERWLHELYRDAEKEMRGKWDAFFRDIRTEGDKLLKAIDDAPDEKAKKKAWRDYTAFMRDATTTDKYYRKMVDELARQYANAGKRAAEIVNGERFGAFADGYNFSADKINSAAIEKNIGIRFDLCDAGTVEYLSGHTEDLLLPPRSDPSTLDLAVWNAHNINAQVTQGIVQGESIPHLAERLSNVTRMNEVAAVRTARTMTTACENAGRVQSMRTAESWGVKTRKQWMCTHDARTRDSHLQLEGETVEENEEFSNGCRYPGDPKGRPEEVYNCRCTLGTVIDGFSSNLPPDKQGAIHVFVDGEELEQGRNYMTPTSYANRDAARRILEKREQKRIKRETRQKQQKTQQKQATVEQAFMAEDDRPYKKRKKRRSGGKK